MGSLDMVPSDVTLEIFSRLPAEDVIECKLVSKHWRDLVQHPYFSQMHLNHLNGLDSAYDSDKVSLMLYAQVSDEKSFCYTEYDENLNRVTRTKRINLKFPFGLRCNGHCILGSCNGLICFSARLDVYWIWQLAYICNPITREYLVLPKFEGKNCWMLSGFGYVPSTNEYKVVRIYNSKEDSNYGIVQVYTLGSGTGWRHAGKMNYDVQFFSIHGVFANGTIHWVANGRTIVAFDLINEEFRELPSPPCSRRGPINFDEIHVLGEFLCGYSLNNGLFDIWVLKKNKSNHDVFWSKEFSRVHAQPITITKSGWLLGCDCVDNNVYRYPLQQLHLPESESLLILERNLLVESVTRTP